MLNFDHHGRFLKLSFKYKGNTNTGDDVIAVLHLKLTYNSHSLVFFWLVFSFFFKNCLCSIFTSLQLLNSFMQQRHYSFSIKDIQTTEKKPVKMFQYINSNQNVVTFINVVMKGLIALLQTETMTLVVTTPN